MEFSVFLIVICIPPGNNNNLLFPGGIHKVLLSKIILLAMYIDKYLQFIKYVYTFNKFFCNF